MTSIQAAAVCLVLPAMIPPLGAVELSIQYPALERILAQQLFTQEGRRYFRGSKATKCSFAYLENPKIGAENDRLRVQAHFSGRSAADFFGRCIGVGDAFDLVIRALPFYRDGVIGFRELQVESPGRDGFYIRRVRAAMAQSLARDFEYRLYDETKRVLEEKRPGAPYLQRVQNFKVPKIRLTAQALIVTLEFGLAVQ